MSKELEARIADLETKLTTLTNACDNMFEAIATSFAALASIGIKANLINRVSTDSSSTEPETTEEG